MINSTLIPETLYKRFRNSYIYRNFRNSIKKYRWVHYLFHSSFCLILDSARQRYDAYTPKEWIEHHKTLKKPV